MHIGSQIFLAKKEQNVLLEVLLQPKLSSDYK